MSGCVKLLKAAVGQRRESGSESPLSYEYRRMCFSIFTVCFDTCLLERLNQVDEAIAIGEKIPGLPAYGTISIKAAQEVHDQLTILENGGDCDWIFGWSSTIQPRFTPLLAPSDASDLMSILWNDRWHLLTIFGLLNLLFLLSRHVFHERYLRYNPEGQILYSRLYELALRHLVAANKYHLVAAMQILAANSTHREWTFTSKHMDARDSRLIEIIPEMLFDALAMPINPEHTHPYQLPPSIQAQIIDNILSTDLLDVTARVIIQLDPAQVGRRSTTLNSILFFYESLEDAVSSFELSQKLWDYVLVWRKYEKLYLCQMFESKILRRSMSSDGLDVWRRYSSPLAFVLL